MAYHAGAELSGIECFQINPLIKDYNGPACAYVANPFGGYQVNAHGERFVDSDYWSGQMMAEVKSEIESARGPDLPQGQPPARRDPDRAGEHPAHHRAADPRHVPRQSRSRLPHPRHRDAHLGNRFVQWSFRVGRLGRRARAHHRPRPVRRGRPGLRAAQLHDRRVRLRRPRRRRRGIHSGRRGCAAAASRRSGARCTRTDLPPAAQPRRSAAAAGRVQAAPVRQRLRGTTEDGRQAVAGRADLRADARRGGRYRRPHPARTDARGRGVLHPGLRRDGGPVLAHPRPNHGGVSTTIAPIRPPATTRTGATT